MQTPPVRLSLAPGTTAHQLMAQGMPESSAYRVLKQGWYCPGYDQRDYPQHDKHYLGSCQDLERRLTQHGKGRGARLLEVVHAVGIGWQLARTWCGGKQRERQLKNQGGASRLCPLCKEARRATHHEIS